MRLVALLNKLRARLGRSGEADLAEEMRLHCAALVKTQSARRFVSRKRASNTWTTSPAGEKCGINGWIFEGS